MKSILFFFFLFIMFSVISCKSNDTVNTKEVQYEEVIIPVNLQEDTVIAAHLKRLSHNLTSFSIIMEGIADELDAMDLNKKKLGFMQKLKLAQIILPHKQKVLHIFNEISEIETISNQIKDTLCTEKLEDFVKFEKQETEKINLLVDRFNAYLQNAEK